MYQNCFEQTQKHVCNGAYDHYNYMETRLIGSDVLLLADVFENFRKNCMQYYKLDPWQCSTSPGLSWDAMLKMTDIKLELITGIDMFQFI